MSNAKELIVEIRRISVAHRLNLEVLQYMSPYCLEDIALHLVRSVMTLPCKGTLEIPATWWDAVKERFFKGVLRKRFPPKYTHYKAEMMFEDVELPMSLMEKGKTVITWL